MQQLSIKLNAPEAGASERPALDKREHRFRALLRWLNQVLTEQRALDEQVTAPLLRRYRQQKSHPVVE